MIDCNELRKKRARETVISQFAALTLMEANDELKMYFPVYITAHTILS